VKRRDFITLLGGAVAWPVAVRAQQPAMPVIGLLSARGRDESAHLVAAFRRGLAESGAIDGESVTIDIAGRTANTTGYPRWRRISRAARWRFWLPLAANPLRGPPWARRRRFQ
jgi:hypothetical protein